MSEMHRYRVTFKKAGKDSWSRVVYAGDPRDAIDNARGMAAWLGVDVEGHTPRVVEEA